MKPNRLRLLGLGEPHPVVVPVEDGVVLSDEDVPQDPQGAGGGGDVQAHEAAQTDGLSSLGDLLEEGDGGRRQVTASPGPRHSRSLSFSMTPHSRRRPLLADGARTLRTYWSPVRL